MNPVPFILLAISLPLLLGGCGEKPVAEVKPESDSVNAEELEERESIMYLKDSETPYTGNVYSVHPNGKKEVEGNYKDGEKEGLWVEWYLDGQKKSEENYKDGELDGIRVGWHSNGNKFREENWKDDKKGFSAKYWNSKGVRVDSREEALKE